MFFFLLHSSLHVCMKTYGKRLFVSVRQTFISRLSRIFEEKQDPSTSVKEQRFSDRESRDLICTLALSPVTCVSASSPWPSSSLSWTNERRFVRCFPHSSPTPFLTSSPLAQPFRGQLEKKFHSRLTAAHLFSSASSCSPLRERGLAAGERTGSVLLQRGCEETKAGPEASGPQSSSRQ